MKSRHSGENRNPEKIEESSLPSCGFRQSDEPIRITIEDWIDLHTFSPKEIPSLLEEYLSECQKKGFTEVRIIHGKGRGVQMNMAHSFLKKSPLVESFKLAPPEAGSWGATIVILKRPE